MLGAPVNVRPLSRAASAVLALVVMATTLAAPAAAAPRVEPALAATLQARIDQWRANHHAPGVAVAVRLPDGSRWVGTSGSAIRGANGRKVEAYTPFAVASLTKTFMAALILQLRDEGEFWLGTPISRWLPNYPRAGKITVKMLLNHRSGVADYFAHPRYEQKVFGRPKHVWTTREILSIVPPRVCAPDTCYRYSNTNYVLLNKIVRKVTGKSAAQEIRRRFLKPLGLIRHLLAGPRADRQGPRRGLLVDREGLQALCRWLAPAPQHLCCHRGPCRGRHGLVGAGYLGLAGRVARWRVPLAQVDGADADLPQVERLWPGHAPGVA